MRKNSIKNIRINGEVLRELSRIIRSEVKDPRIHPMTTVTAVEVTPDLKYCKAYISVLGTQEEAEASLAGLRCAVGYIRKELARSVNLRNTPEITFVLDRSIEYGVRMTTRIQEVREAERQNETLTGTDEEE
ncbi:MAG: 30S ribosome-binding factor RbfA [Lachnospiraceae bacterium]|nr:30S ribosome-binding factor RbfA [Lachnospiraceae bacterium]